MSASAPRVLVVDDEPLQRQILQTILGTEGFEAAAAGNARQALQAARGEPFDVVLTDLKMPDLNGIELLEELLKTQPGLCVVIMTAHGTIDSAVQAMRKGAFDYLTKPLDKEQLLIVLRRALERSALMRENRLLQEQLRDRFRLASIVGAHGSMQDVFRVVHKVAASASTVLIYGESGTGKELVARALHQESDRRQRPFFAVNVASLPESILEAELFGYEKGAFTGAEARKVGLIEQAAGSTLFLDEVGDLKRDLQVKILRTLQEREILRVGGTERIRIDVRFVAATHQDLERAVREGRFRQDLYYRLNVIPLTLPPLRERRTDIPLLVEHFVKKYAGARPRTVAPAALQLLVAYDWPGNVRELESVVERALLLGDGPQIVPADLPDAVTSRLRLPRGAVDVELPEGGIDLRELERSLIARALERTAGNVSRAARLLGLSRRTLQYRIAKLQGAPSGSATARDGAHAARPAVVKPRL
jgi:DNA-binding NtrC family response regulator